MATRSRKQTRGSRLLALALASTATASTSPVLQLPRVPRREKAVPTLYLPQKEAVYKKGEPAVRRYYKYAVAGAVACSATRTMTVPFDVLKVTLQTSKIGLSTLGAIKSVLRSGGVFAFFDGAGAQFIGYGLQGAVKFGGYELGKNTGYRLLGIPPAVRGPAAPQQQQRRRRRLWPRQEEGQQQQQEQEQQQQQQRARRRQQQNGPRLAVMLAAAANAEVFASLVLCPFELAKLRMQTDPTFLARGLGGTLSHIARTEGAASLFRGFGPLALRQVPYTMCKLVTFELAACSMLAVLSRAPERHANLATSLRPAAVAVAGLCAGAAAVIISQPGDVLLTRLCGCRVPELADLTGCFVTPSLGEALSAMLATGWRGCYAGLLPRLCSISGTTSLQFLIYDQVLRSQNVGTLPGY